MLADKKIILLKSFFEKTSINSNDILNSIFSFLFIPLDKIKQKHLLSIQNSISRNTKIFTDHGISPHDNMEFMRAEYTPLELWGFSTNYGTSPYFKSANCQFCGHYLNWSEFTSLERTDEGYKKSSTYFYDIYSSGICFELDYESPYISRIFCMCGEDEDFIDDNDI